MVATALGEVIGWVIVQSTVAVALAEVRSWVIVPSWHCISSIVEYHTYYMTGQEEQTAPIYKALRWEMRYKIVDLRALSQWTYEMRYES